MYEILFHKYEILFRKNEMLSRKYEIKKCRGCHFSNNTSTSKQVKVTSLVGPLSFIQPFSHPFTLTSPGHWTSLGN